jgi:hypothetical protein
VRAGILTRARSCHWLKEKKKNMNGVIAYCLSVFNFRFLSALCPLASSLLVCDLSVPSFLAPSLLCLFCLSSLSAPHLTI